MNTQEVEYSQEIANVLDMLADRFGTTAEFLWSTLISYHYTMGVMGVTVSALTLVTSAILFYFSWESHNILERGGIDYRISQIHKNSRNEFFLGGVVAVLITTVLMFNSLPSLLIPEYAALREILQTIR